jgi:predicted  nucleic acid-binding Zn-ribbon protein
VAEIRNNACMGCRVRLRPQAINELRLNATIRYCESCHRIQFFVVNAFVV